MKCSMSYCYELPLCQLAASVNRFLSLTRVPVPRETDGPAVLALFSRVARVMENLHSFPGQTDSLTRLIQQDDVSIIKKYILIHLILFISYFST